MILGTWRHDGAVAGWLSCGGGGFGFGLVVGGCGKLCGDAALVRYENPLVKSRTNFYLFTVFEIFRGRRKMEEKPRGGMFVEFSFLFFRSPSVRKDI